VKANLLCIASLCAISLVRTAYVNGQCDPPTNILIVEDYAWPRIIDYDNKDDVAWDVIPLDDGGVVVVGETEHGNPTKNHALIIRLDEFGDDVWPNPVVIEERSFNVAYSVKLASDGNLIVCGKIFSNQYGSPANLNAWYFKLDLSDGSTIDDTYYEFGGLGDDFAWDIIEDVSTDPDQYVIVGGTGDVADGTLEEFDEPGINGAGEAWVFAIDPTTPEDPIWQNIYSGDFPDESEHDYAHSIIIDHNEKYLVSGYCFSCREENSLMQALLLKIKKDGTETFWQNDYGDEGLDNVRDQASNAAIEFYDATIPAYGYVGAGITHPDEDDCFEGKTHDYYVYETTNTGVSNWSGGCELTDGFGYGGSKDDNGYSILQTCDGNYLIVGASKSKGDDVSCNHYTSPATFDAWMMKVDAATGAILWDESLGDVFNDEFHSIIQLEDGSFIAVGEFGAEGDNEEQNFYIVKFELTECVEPTNLDATSQDGCTKIKFEWDGHPCAKEYVLRYRTASTGWTEETTTLTEFTTGTLPTGNYQWKVKAKCSPNVYSDFTDVSYHILSPCRIASEDTETESGVLSVYPQPSDGSLHFSFTYSSEISLATTINIKDYAGRIVETIPVTIENGVLDFKHSLGNIPPGFYFIHLVVKGIFAPGKAYYSKALRLINSF
jgi:hypothetical protein